MNYYEIWCNLKDSHKDLEFAQAVHAYLGELKSRGLIEDFRLTRRKLGFGPPELGEFHMSLACRDLVQLEQAFEVIAQRGGEIEKLHANVYARVTDFRSALYRSFPDPQREPQS